MKKIVLTLALVAGAAFCGFELSRINTAKAAVVPPTDNGITCSMCYSLCKHSNPQADCSYCHPPNCT